jgi:hypothetical protein
MCTDTMKCDDDLGEATVHTQEAIRLLIKYRNRKPLIRQQRVQFDRFRG